MRAADHKAVRAAFKHTHPFGGWCSECCDETWGEVAVCGAEILLPTGLRRCTEPRPCAIHGEVR